MKTAISYFAGDSYGGLRDPEIVHCLDEETELPILT